MNPDATFSRRESLTEIFGITLFAATVLVVAAGAVAMCLQPALPV